jgi:hypothetical protein
VAFFSLWSLCSLCDGGWKVEPLGNQDSHPTEPQIALPRYHVLQKFRDGARKEKRDP